MQTFQDAVFSDDSVARRPLNPSFRYLRVEVDGRVALLVLGDQDDDGRGLTDVWYSAQKEVLRFRDGRLVGAVGLTTEWRNVVVPMVPSWSALARLPAPFRWTRVRDVMPGYRMGVADVLSLRHTLPPSRTRLQGVDPKSLAWFEETVVTTEGGDENLPLARYAVDLRGASETVVYGEQCLSPQLCFSWQRWPVGK